MPQTAGQNRVRWDEFDWRYVDLLDEGDMGAGLRLYYYESEKEVAERAAAAIEEEYRELVKIFDLKPAAKIPYILYNTHQELEQTNLFPIGEGTLGATSPEDLRMTLSYWGDHQRFRHVSLHEMVHQFTIQKVGAVAGDAKISGSPLMDMPLWFIEGLAEFYSQPGGFTPDDEWWVRDLVANPAPERGWFLRGFFEDDVRSFAFTYKLGQARVYFLAHTYGQDVPQKILSESWRMRPGRGSGLFGRGGERGREAMGFPQLVKSVTGDSPQKIQAKWEDWLKKRYYSQYLQAKQQPSDWRQEDAVRGIPDWFTISPDGNALVYRTIDPMTGITSLMIVDPQDAGSARRVARDGGIGVDSLHYGDRAVAALDEKRIAWISRRGPNDVVRVGRWKRESEDTERGGTLRVNADLSVGGFRLFDPRPAGIRELGWPAFSPDGTRIAFIALDMTGVVDIWTLDLDDAKWTRVTNDLYAERELDWGEAGIAFTSDATAPGNFNLFLLKIDEGGGVERLTISAANHRTPRFAPGKNLLYYSGDEAGKWDVYALDLDAAPVTPPHRETPLPVGESGSEPGADRVPTAGLESATPGPFDPLPAPLAATTGGDATATVATDAGDGAALTQVTDFATGITQPIVAGGRLWGMAFVSGRFRVFSLAENEMLKLAPTPASQPAPPAGPPWTIPSRPLTDVTEYKPWNTGNWALENAFVALGAGNGLFGGGFVFFQDILRDRTVIVQGQAFGDVSLTDLSTVYFDRTRRVQLGVAVFASPTFVLDPEFSDGLRPIYFLERRLGVVGLAEYPFNRYLRVGSGLGVSATDRSVPDWLDNFENRAQRESWRQRNDGTAAQFDSSLHAGYDSLVWSWETGPLTGSSVLATVNGYYQPARDDTWFGDASIDAQRYFRLGSTVALGFRATAGRTLGDEWRRPFYVYSVDNMRGVPWYRYDYLISDAYTIGQAQLALPLNSVLRFALFNSVIGVAGIDAGSLFDEIGQAEENATAAGVLGVNMRLAIFELRLHFARPFDVGGLEPGVTEGADGRPIVPDGWVTNFSLRYAWF